MYGMTLFCNIDSTVCVCVYTALFVYLYTYMLKNRPRHINSCYFRVGITSHIFLFQHLIFRQEVDITLHFLKLNNLTARSSLTSVLAAPPQVSSTFFKTLL